MLIVLDHFRNADKGCSLHSESGLARLGLTSWVLSVFLAGGF